MLQSEQVSVAAPFSFQGSAERLWRLGNYFTNDTARFVYLVVAAVLLIPTAWTLVLSWYCTFGLLVVPYRLVRRSQRNDRKAKLRHRELVNRSN